MGIAEDNWAESLDTDPKEYPFVLTVNYGMEDTEDMVVGFDSMDEARKYFEKNVCSNYFVTLDDFWNGWHYTWNPNESGWTKVRMI